MPRGRLEVNKLRTLGRRGTTSRDRAAKSRRGTSAAPRHVRVNSPAPAAPFRGFKRDDKCFSHVFTCAPTAAPFKTRKWRSGRANAAPDVSKAANRRARAKAKFLMERVEKFAAHCFYFQQHNSITKRTTAHDALVFVDEFLKCPTSRHLFIS